MSTSAQAQRCRLAPSRAQALLLQELCWLSSIFNLEPSVTLYSCKVWVIAPDFPSCTSAPGEDGSVPHSWTSPAVTTHCHSKSQPGPLHLAALPPPRIIVHLQTLLCTSETASAFLAGISDNFRYNSMGLCGLFCLFICGFLRGFLCFCWVFFRVKRI